MGFSNLDNCKAVVLRSRLILFYIQILERALL